MVKHARNLGKRLFYNYYLRNMSLASLQLPLGVSMLLFGSVYGAWHWVQAAAHGVATPAGTVMVSALPVLMGMQLILAFLAYDIAAVPRRVVQKKSVARAAVVVRD